MGKPKPHSKGVQAMLDQRLAGIVYVGKGKYVCDDCGETRSITSKGRHWSSRRGTICRGRPAKHGRINAVDRNKRAEQTRKRNEKNRGKEYPAETGESIRPIYIGKHKQ